MFQALRPAIRRPRLSLRLPAALLALFVSLLLTLRPATAQDLIWVQVEAQPTRAEALDRAGAYAGLFPETRGFVLRSGWHAIVLGPFPAAEGLARMQRLKSDGMIPPDSYITDGAEFREPFWPVAGAEPAPPPAVTEAPTAEVVPVEPPPPAEETTAQARASEAALSADDKKMLQVALQWFGHYAGAIDGSYGSGTRNAMAAWQTALGLEPTGILTTRQRATLVANYEADLAEYDFRTVEDAQAGISVTLPMALVEFDRYEAPFVQFKPKGEDGLSIVLISQPGDAATFAGLYDILQTLEAVPEGGERSRSDRQFRIHGSSAGKEALIWAGFQNGQIKGWMILSTPATAERDARIMQVVEQSFRSIGDAALAVPQQPLTEAARRGLIAGLAVKTPKSGRSGFYIDGRGTVLTTVAAVESCGRITLDRATDATVAFTDAASGLAVLKPAAALSPPAFATFAAAPARVGDAVAVAGYSYAERLPAPVLTFGTVEELAGLAGEAGVNRLSVETLPGDAGGPVLDASGAVLGMLLPTDTDPARSLPRGVGLVADAAALTGALAAAGIQTVKAPADAAALPPEPLQRKGTGMTVLVSCWE
ncbi:serine protease [Neotabrizicola sp. VNH66]|uniref:serine protease n=1 Tax=Neotabrizicola sp. VNH66 TaxID=3400918 RepID=UPI003C025D77